MSIVVHQWARAIGLDSAAYGTHSMRRTKATFAGAAIRPSPAKDRTFGQALLDRLENEQFEQEYCKKLFGELPSDTLHRYGNVANSALVG